MHVIAADLQIDVSRLMFNLIPEASLDNSSRAHLPFRLLLWSHALDLDYSDDEAHPPLVATNILYTSTAPPPTAPAAAAAALTTASNSRIVDAIAALFAHVNVIHVDLVERIGLVQERVDLIMERQAHDIKAIRDTLSVLSHQHTEFITEVNDFITII
ncbi:hypothetical protein Acr_17g0008420 [Actinidia rufa]|uniref:Uncharacterized protein n=1 Tax=Actinidia rufa TaxID=165716 RepID=A0A7J0G3B4_9ERIC|nr:hypothetical protein Acr_17g0008420 [Actinidia rufa]